MTIAKLALLIFACMTLYCIVADATCEQNYKVLDLTTALPENFHHIPWSSENTHTEGGVYPIVAM